MTPVPEDPIATRLLALASATQALRFGSFALKSGRISPYFFNAGAFCTGASLAALADCYADRIVASGIAFDLLFGPAYKGIPLACATACALSRRHGRDLPWAFDRKQAKDHGEGGRFVGAALAGRVLMVDDVITAGTAARESVAKIRSAGAEAVGLVVALDRQERGQGRKSACQEVADDLGLPVLPIATLADLLAFAAREARPEDLAALQDYRARYGI